MTGNVAASNTDCVCCAEHFMRKKEAVEQRLLAQRALLSCLKLMCKIFLTELSLLATHACDSCRHIGRSAYEPSDLLHGVLSVC